MYESSKTRSVRGPDFEATYLAGTVLDIGSGRDVVVPHAQPFDQQEGDANRILHYLEPGSFDTVHSSHCLEHMLDAEQALQDWWQLVKPGGHLIIVVPHEDLYEQGKWPSIFNPDHKTTFRLNSSRTWSPRSFDLYDLVGLLPGAKIVAAEVQDDGYKHDLQKLDAETPDAKTIRLIHMELVRQLLHKELASLPLLDELNLFFASLGACVDQTLGSALAQIQVIARKPTIA